jgi:hypothetical protein
MKIVARNKSSIQLFFFIMVQRYKNKSKNEYNSSFFLVAYVAVSFRFRNVLHFLPDSFVAQDATRL